MLVAKCNVNDTCIIVVVVYIPDKIGIEKFETFFECLEQLDCLHYDNILILGDFNIPKLSENCLHDRKVATFLNFLDLNQFLQVNGIKNKLGRLLDLVLCRTNCITLSDDCPLVPEDDHHPSLNVQLTISFNKVKRFKPNSHARTYNYRKADFPCLYNQLSLIDWDILNNFSDENAAVRTFYELLFSVFDKHIPLFSNYSHRYPSWYTSEIIRNIKLKAKFRDKYKKTHNERDLIEFKRLRKLVKEQIKIKYGNYLEEVQSSIKSNPNYFWNYIHNKNNTTRIPGIMKIGDVKLSNPQDIVDSFANFLSSAYTSSSVESQDYSSKPNFDNLDFKPVTDDEILLAIGKLKNKMSSGPDNIPSFLVKDCSHVIVTPLKIIFNLSLNNQSFPRIWREARVCPIFKSGDRSSIENYRGVVMLSNFSKIFETILYNRIYNSVQSRISPDQHGFMNKRSTISNMTIITQYISEILDCNGQVDVIYTDFAKAFDRVDHGILLDKLTACGFTEKAKRFIKSYLAIRTLYVSYKGFVSHKFVATSGVPQGSNLGPLLFLLFINDLCETLTCNKLCYADDLKIFASIKTGNNCEYLQQQLNIIQSWCEHNKLYLNVKKCKVMRYTRKHNVVEFPYYVLNDILEVTNSVRDLGVTFDSTLSFSIHISTIVSEAFKSYGFIVRNCRNFTDIKPLIILYFAYIRTKLEYASIIWYPLYECHKTSIERVQRKFLKYLAYKIDGVYPERGVSNTILCERMHFVSLESRRICASLSFLYKLLHNKIDCINILNMINIHVPKGSTRFTVAFRCSRARTNILLKSPIYVMCSNYNNICNRCDIFYCTLQELTKCSLEYLR